MVCFGMFDMDAETPWSGGGKDNPIPRGGLLGFEPFAPRSCAQHAFSSDDIRLDCRTVLQNQLDESSLLCLCPAAVGIGRKAVSGGSNVDVTVSQVARCEPDRELIAFAVARRAIITGYRSLR